MEKHRVCRICSRRFANGKAMGGHMRSHFAKLPLPPKRQQPQPPPPPLPHSAASTTATPPPTSTSLSSSSTHHRRRHDATPSSVSLKDLQRSLRLHSIATNRSSANSESSLVATRGTRTTAVHDKESDTESSQRINTTRRRSNRRPRRRVVMECSELVSSVSESTLFSEEDVALCLVTLSRDTWSRKDGELVRRLVFADESEDEEENGSESDEESDGDEEDESFCTAPRKYKCETCSKVFGSHQALGGHRASHNHKKIKLKDGNKVGSGDNGDNNNSNNNGGGGDEAKAVDDGRMLKFKCPFCDKVFDSGQGLGGHKKVHFFNNNNNNKKQNDHEVAKSEPAGDHNNKKKEVGETMCLIDLNLPPAPEEEDGEDDVEHVL